MNYGDNSMYTQNRDEEVALIKALLTGRETECPKCKKAHLEHFHKKAKKSNTDYVCPLCKERYQVIRMLDDINRP